MQRRAVTFASESLRLGGDLYLPDGLEPGTRRPIVIGCSGYQGLKDMQPARFARALVPAGYACLSFDYRSFGVSEGQRGRLIPQEQVGDVRSAIDFLETVGEVASDQIVLVGWALGGGIAIAAAAADPRVRAVVAVNAIGDGARATRALHDEQSWRLLLDDVRRDAEVRAVNGRSRAIDPFAVVRLDEETLGYVRSELAPHAGFGTQVTLDSVEWLLRFRPEEVVDRISPRPLLLVHGAANRLHAPEEALELYRRAAQPKELVLLEGTGHTEWMYDDHPTFRRLVVLILNFLRENLS